MTLLEATIGTPWELDTEDSILVLEDRAMKPYQVDRVLMHLNKPVNLKACAGLCWEDFPESEPPWRSPIRTGSLRANSAAARRPDHFWCTSWAYGSAYAYDTAGHQGAPGRRWGRHTRIPGIGGGGLSETNTCM